MMNNRYKITVALIAILFLGLEAIAQTPKPKNNKIDYIDVTIEELIATPKKYNEKQVTLVGEVKEFKYTTSSKGEPFTLFRLIDADNNEIRVYYEDKHLPFTKGDQVKIEGKYWKHKRYFFYKVKNVIKARRAYIL